MDNIENSRRKFLKTAGTGLVLGISLSGLVRAQQKSGAVAALAQDGVALVAFSPMPLVEILVMVASLCRVRRHSSVN